ncbi:hypothetical protein [Sphingomonas sp.]|uniref:hypothetical protein n=1 Tax=Sphingomonas sp. TaxID=28214 RepID=UPI0035C839D3
MSRAVERQAARAVQAVVARLAARLRDVPGVTVEQGEGRVSLSGAGLHARRLEEARLRDVAGWLR